MCKLNQAELDGCQNGTSADRHHTTNNVGSSTRLVIAPPPPPQQTGVKCLTHTIKTVIRSLFIQIFAILMKVN